MWTANVFESAASYKDACAVPRSGRDLEGKSFPDQPGSTLIEKFWLRSWTEETYLFYTEVTDRDPNLFGDRLAYFSQLRTFAVTPSGEDKDEFHFSEPTDAYLAASIAAPTAGYGVSFEVESNTAPRSYTVRYVNPGTPAAQEVGGVANFVRGERIISIDGADFVNGNDTDTLTDGLFPENPGEMHSFVLEDGNGVRRTVSVTSANVTPDPVNAVRTISTGTGKVGYIFFNTFTPVTAEDELVDAVTQLATENVTDLVLDLRYNGGGLIAIASQLAYMVAGSGPTAGNTFERLRFNDAAGTINPVTGQANQPFPFYDTGLGFSVPNGQALPTLNLGRVFVLSTENTCSASETVINGLRGVDVEVILIGDTTCGKPFGFYPTDNCGETYFTIQFQGVNDKGFGDYTDGFVPMNSAFPFGVKLPGCQVADDLDRPIGMATDPLLDAALDYRALGTCPPPTTRAVQLSQPAGGFSKGEPLTQRGNIFDTNRDLRMPGDFE
ncbi:MAG: S41 family peptidase [Pseudomonadota bacterium]